MREWYSSNDKFILGSHQLARCIHGFPELFYPLVSQVFIKLQRRSMAPVGVISITRFATVCKRYDRGGQHHDTLETAHAFVESLDGFQVEVIGGFIQ